MKRWVVSFFDCDDWDNKHPGCMFVEEAEARSYGRTFQAILYAVHTWMPCVQVSEKQVSLWAVVRQFFTSVSSHNNTLHEWVISRKEAQP